jgi:hypothetical protein
MAETVNQTLAKRHAAEDSRLDARMAKARAKIRRNFPNERAAVQWRRVSANRLLSHCGQFEIERSGTGEAARYTAKRLPSSVIGARLYTVEEAKQACDSQASPLPLEPPITEAVEREPGSDDE